VRYPNASVTSGIAHRVNNVEIVARVLHVAGIVQKR